MTPIVSSVKRHGRLKFVFGAAIVAATLAAATAITIHKASATTSVGLAAQTANGELSSCGKNTGTALYGCVADVLNRFCYATGRGLSPGTKQSFDGAIARLRRAVNKVEALSAVAQARSAIAGALQQARGGGQGGSADAGDYAAISSLLGHAAQLIQAKG